MDEIRLLANYEKPMSLRVRSVRYSMLDQCTFSPCVIILRLMMENENYLVHILALHASLPSNWKYIALFECIALELVSFILLSIILLRVPA